MDLDLTGRVYLVAGSSRGIGKAIAASLLVEGARVCITGRDRESLEQSRRSLGTTERCLHYTGDLSDPGHVAAAFATIERAWGRLDGVIANLGTGTGSPGWDQSDEDWERLIRHNLRASTLLAEAAIPLLDGNGGSIIFISSITGVEATPAPLPYSAAKAALINYSKNLAREIAAKNIRVNCVAPGNILFEGGSWARRLDEQGSAVMKMIEREVPLGRFGKPEEIADLVLFLCSNRSSFITGACIVADGGQTKSL